MAINLPGTDDAYRMATTLDPTNYTLACWVNPDIVTNAEVLLGFIKDATGKMNYIHMRGDEPGDYFACARWDGTDWENCDSTTSGVAGTWFHVLGIITGDSKCEIYVNNGGYNSNANATVGWTPDYIPVGAKWAGVAIDYELDGQICECAIWNVNDFTSEERQALADGFSPLFVRPQSLIFYTPAIRAVQDFISGTVLTATGTPAVANHPRIIYPATPMIITAPAAVGANAPTGVFYGPFVGPFGGPI